MKIALLKVIVALLAGLVLPRTVFAQQLPNFIIINVDDLGYGDIGPYGNRTQATPNIDRLAAEGRKLTSHYAAPVCSPSRASLMTGSYAKRALPIPHVLFPASPVGLNPAEITIAELLKTKGYRTGCIGKWHLGDQLEFLPTRQGFDYYFGLPYSNDMGPVADGIKSNWGQPLPQPKELGSPIPGDFGVTGNNQPPLPLLENETVVDRIRVSEHLALTKRYTEKAVSFIEQNANQPFFLYFPHSAVHFPLYPSESFRGTSQNGLFGDWVSEVDWSVGEIIGALVRLGLRENTLLVFTSDNGGATRHGSDNSPLRGAKGSTWEGGIRVPTICSWPGRIPAGTETSAITAMPDLLPTLCALAEVPLPIDRKLDGVNQWAVMSGDPAIPPRQQFLYYRGLSLEAVREGNWKFRLVDQSLYDLDTDIGEQKNLFAANPEIVVRLQKLVEAAAADLGLDGLGPNCRPLGRVANPQPLGGLALANGHYPMRLESSQLPNLIQMHANVFSGGQPSGDAAFDELQRLGVRTLISVDGALPDVALAHKHGMRYVHLPHGYNGISDSRAVELAKAVKSLPGPLYIHCHHGKHRSPAAASVACILAGLVPAEQGSGILKLAGTDTHYVGLYTSVERARQVPASELETLFVEFRSQVPLGPLADAMIDLEHTADNIAMLARNGWEAPEGHPELNLEHEALLMREHYQELLRRNITLEPNDSFRQALRQSHEIAISLERLSHLEIKPSARLDQAWQKVVADCRNCHQLFRDPPLLP